MSHVILPTKQSQNLKVLKEEKPPNEVINSPNDEMRSNKMTFRPTNLLSCPVSKYGLKSPTWLRW